MLESYETQICRVGKKAEVSHVEANDDVGHWTKVLYAFE
jgi:hypothetical protein